MDISTTSGSRTTAPITRVLRFWQNVIDGSIDLLAKLVEDEHRRVRLEAVLACGYSSSEKDPVP